MEPDTAVPFGRRHAPYIFNAAAHHELLSCTLHGKAAVRKTGIAQSMTKGIAHSFSRSIIIAVAHIETFPMLSHVPAG